MYSFERLVKAMLLFVFSVLNAIDMAQTIAFLRMGIEGNIFAVAYPQLWFALKSIFAFGLPLGLYYLDLYLETKEEEGFYEYLNRLLGFFYIIIFLADLFYLQLVIRNTAILGRVLP